MGREIRRVPANWEHPKYTKEDTYEERRWGQYKPLLEGYEKALEEFAQKIKTDGLAEAIEYHGGGPRIDDYAQYNGASQEWWQVYETVSDGTPVSPPFATPEELIEYLVANGDFWDQRRGDKGWSRKSAENFVKCGFAMSMVVTPERGVQTGVEFLGNSNQGEQKR